MIIHIDWIPTDRPAAIRFDNINQAAVFMEALNKLYPYKVFSFENTPWSNLYAKDGGMCYCPYLNMPVDDVITYGSKNYFVRMRGIDVIDFDSLCEDVELETGVSDLPIDVLLGGLFV